MRQPLQARAHRGRSLPAALLLALASALGLAALWWWLAAPLPPAAPTGPWAWLPMLVFGAVCAVAGLLWGHQRQQQRLHTLAADHLALTELSPDWLWLSDTEHQIVQWRPPPQAADVEWAAVPPPPCKLWERFEACSGDTASLRARLDAQGRLHALPVRWPDHSAETLWQLNALPRRDSQGQFLGYLGSARPLEEPPSTATDASPAPAAAEVVEVAPTLDAAELAAEQDSFVYSVSHDLRAPLRVVDGFARILKEDYSRFLDRIGNDHLDRVLTASARMSSMIDALLALSRLQSQPLHRKPVDLSQLAHYIVEDLQREAPDRQAEVLIEPGLVVQGDPTLLRIAMENLLGNAWKYSANRCPTRIEFRQEHRDGQRVLVVADNGAGFDMRFADRLFGVFQRLHSPKDFQGTGVGLATVRRILRRHGGDIWAEAEVDQGARFFFKLGD